MVRFGFQLVECDPPLLAGIVDTSSTIFEFLEAGR